MKGEGTKEWIQRLNTLNQICSVYDYHPRFAQTESGFSPSADSVYGCQNANVLTQAVYYMRRVLLDATMRSDAGDFWTYSLYWVHHYNGDTIYDTGWFGNHSYVPDSSRPIRKVGRILHSHPESNNSLPGLSAGMRVWLPARSVRGEEDPTIGYNTMTCGWINALDEKWGAMWNYRNNTSVFYEAPYLPQELNIEGTGHGMIHLFKFQFDEPYDFDHTEWIQITETPIAGRADPLNANKMIYDLPPTIEHSQYGTIQVVSENPVFFKFGYPNTN